MTDTSKLKKGVPSPRKPGDRELGTDPRLQENRNQPLQVMVPPDVFEAFGKEAGRVFGHRKGSKSEMFLELWRLYRSMES